MDMLDVLSIFLIGFTWGLLIGVLILST
jgi:hypothetical protein